MDLPLRFIEMSREEVEYLIGAGFLSRTQLELIHNAKWRTASRATLELSPAVAEDFRDAFTEQLAAVGFDEIYELTPEGKSLENLIDRFHKMDPRTDSKLPGL